MINARVRQWVILVCAAVAIASGAPSIQDPSPLTRAVERAFPDCAIERTTAYLDEAKRARVRALTGDDGKGVVYPYRVAKDGVLIATVYLDRHVVRSKMETLMVAVGADGSLTRVEVLAFAEPKKYRPRQGWYDQFAGTSLATRPRIGRNIDGISGATLTSRATTRAAVRTLATHAVLDGDGAGGGECRQRIGRASR